MGAYPRSEMERDRAPNSFHFTSGRRSKRQTAHMYRFILLRKRRIRQMKCNEINHVQLPVSDTAAAVAWYRDRLGFQCEQLRDDLAVVNLPSGPSLFVWQTGDGSVATFTRDGVPYPT